MDKKTFRSNDERIAYLRLCFTQGDAPTRDRAVKLAWEWIKTGKFSRKEFEQVLGAYASAYLSASRP